MQINADLTKDELLRHGDVLVYACHPIGKIRAIADMLYCIEEGEHTSGNVFKKANTQILSDMLTDACNEIEYLIDISEDQEQQSHKKGRAGK